MYNRSDIIRPRRMCPWRLPPTHCLQRAALKRTSIRGCQPIGPSSDMSRRPGPSSDDSPPAFLNWVLHRPDAGDSFRLLPGQPSPVSLLGGPIHHPDLVGSLSACVVRCMDSSEVQTTTTIPFPLAAGRPQCEFSSCRYALRKPPWVLVETQRMPSTEQDLHRGAWQPPRRPAPPPTNPRTARGITAPNSDTTTLTMVENRLFTHRRCLAGHFPASFSNGRVILPLIGANARVWRARLHLAFHPMRPAALLPPAHCARSFRSRRFITLQRAADKTSRRFFHHGRSLLSLPQYPYALRISRPPHVSDASALTDRPKKRRLFLCFSRHTRLHVLAAGGQQ